MGREREAGSVISIWSLNFSAIQSSFRFLFFTHLPIIIRKPPDIIKDVSFQKEIAQHVHEVYNLLNYEVDNQFYKLNVSVWF